MGTKIVGMGTAGGDGAGMATNPVRKWWDGDSDNGDGWGWGQIRVPVQLSSSQPACC